MDYSREEVAFSVDNATETESEPESEEGEEEGELHFLWNHFPEFRRVECKRFLADTPVFRQRELMEDALGVLEMLKTHWRLQQTAKSMSGLNGATMPRAWQVFLRWAY